MTQGGLTEATIRNIKKEHPEVYATTLGDLDVAFRPLTVEEYNDSLDIALRESSVDAEEYVINLAVVFPVDLNLDDFMIGEVSALSDEILEQSGFSDYDVCISKIESAREKASEVISFMMAMIIASEQGFTTEQLKKMTFSEVADRAAMAERIFEIKQELASGGQVILDVRNPNEEKAEPKKPTLTPEEYEAIKRGEYVNPEKASTIGAATTEDPIARKLREALQ